MTISYNSNVPKEFQEELNENLRNIENEVGYLDKQVNHQHTVIEEQRLCIATLNNLVEQQQKEIDTLTANLLDTVKSLTVFVKAVEMRLQSIEKITNTPPCIMP